MCTYLGVAALSSHLVDLGLGDVSALLSLLQLMRNLPELGQVGVGCFLLQYDRGGSKSHYLKRAPHNYSPSKTNSVAVANDV